MSRAGFLQDNLGGELHYQSFTPSPLPPEPSLEIDSEMLKKVIEANRELVRLDTDSAWIPNSELFISMYVRKEALISSQIEGTQCTLDDILDPEMEENVNVDVSDVINYINATHFALKRLHTLPICNRFIREVHEKLMSNVRGQEKNPGEFRKSQNWIGAANCTLRDARFIPPNVDDMRIAMSDLEKYINEGDDFDPLIRIALIHYQFETIHPFLDGNGRVGRLLILLYLMEQNLLTRPVIYISYFLKANQTEYYDRISEVRRSGNYEQWVKFFLDAVTHAAVDARESIKKLSLLHDKNCALIDNLGRTKENVMALFSYIENYPIITITQAASRLGMSYNTISTAVHKLEEIGVLRETTNAARNRVYAYEEYLKILRENT